MDWENISVAELLRRICGKYADLCRNCPDGCYTDDAKDWLDLYIKLKQIMEEVEQI